MKFKEERPLGNPEAALARLLAIANGLEADHAGRISVGAINHAFLTAGGNATEYGAAMHRRCWWLDGDASVRCLREIHARRARIWKTHLE
jgi:hypothetical protein